MRDTGGQRTSVSEILCDENGEPLHGKPLRLNHWREHFKDQINWSCDNVVSLIVTTVESEWLRKCIYTVDCIPCWLLRHSLPLLLCRPTPCPSYMLILLSIASCNSMRNLTVSVLIILNDNDDSLNSILSLHGQNWMKWISWNTWVIASRPLVVYRVRRSRIYRRLDRHSQLWDIYGVGEQSDCHLKVEYTQQQ